MKIAIIGCGAIGSKLAELIDGGLGSIELLWVMDRNLEKASVLSSSLRCRPKATNQIEDILRDREVELVVEAASIEAVHRYAEDILRSGKDLVVLSTGAFSDRNFLKRILELVKTGRRVYVPSGAILGLDALKASVLAGVERVELITRKHPSALEGETREFEGNVSEAIKRFPKAINIAVTLALIVGEEKVKVKIIPDPSVTETTHELRVLNKVGEIYCKIKSQHFEQNPRSSKITAYSVASLLKSLEDSFKIGT